MPPRTSHRHARHPNSRAIRDRGRARLKANRDRCGGRRPSRLARGAAHAPEPACPSGVPGRAGDCRFAVASGAAARPCRAVVPAHALLDGEPRPRPRGQSGSRARPLPRATSQWCRDQLRRDRAGQPSPAARSRLGPPRPAQTAPRHPHASARPPLPRRALNVHAARLRPARDSASTLAFMRQIRLACPASTRIYWIQDNLSCHWTKPIRQKTTSVSRLDNTASS
jgi:hypothetical protein